MAEGANAIGNVAGLADILSKLFLGSKTNTSQTVDPAVSAQFNQIFQSLAPQLQGQVISEQEMQALVDSILQKSSQAFAPGRATQAAAGSYNSTAMAQLENDARAKATNEALATIINAKLQSAQSQQNAAQIATGAAGQLGQLTGKKTVETPAALGSLATPLALYAGYKYLTAPKDVGAAAGAAGAGANAATAGANAIQAAIPTVSKVPAGVSDILSGTQGLDLFGSGGSLDAMLSGGGGISSAVSPVISPGAGAGISGAAPAAATAAASSAYAPGTLGAGLSGIFGTDDVLGSAMGGITGAVSDIPLLGDAWKSGTEALSSFNSAFTPQIDFSSSIPGTTGVPLLSGLNNLMKGEPGKAVGDIAATTALGAIPVVGPLLALGSGFTKNGVIDDWFGIDNCFITTAVMKAMESVGIPFRDDCSELEILRNFRDTYMLETPERKALVDEYYRTAPGIVAAISKLEFADEIFLKLYDDYLLPCLDAVSSGENELALELYAKMVSAAKEFALAASEEA